jgi:hypothetical protein
MGNNSNKQPKKQPQEQPQQPTLDDYVQNPAQQNATQNTTPYPTQNPTQNTTQNTLPTPTSPQNPPIQGTQNTPPHGMQHTESNKKHEGPLKKVEGIPHDVTHFASSASSNIYGVGHNAFDTVTHRHKSSNVNNVH